MSGSPSATTRRVAPPSDGSRFGDDDVSDEALRPPLGLLFLGCAAVALSAAMLLGSGRLIDLAGYFLATVVAVFTVAGYRALDSRRRTRPTYVIPRLAQLIPPTLLGLGVLVCGTLVASVHVWRFADFMARQ